MKKIFCAIVLFAAAGCSTTGPFITSVEFDEAGALTLHRCNMRTTLLPFIDTKMVQCVDVKAEPKK